MSRVDDNQEVLKIVEAAFDNGCADDLQMVTLTLLDISRSLAVIADKMDKDSDKELKI